MGGDGKFLNIIGAAVSDLLIRASRQLEGKQDTGGLGSAMT